MAENKSDTKSTPNEENVSGCSTSGENSAVSSVPQTGKSNQVKENDVNGLNHICRVIDFGDSTSIDEMSVLYDEDQRQRQREKWNFDFANEVPLEGDWQWERVPAESPKAQEVVCSLKNNRENRNV